MKSAPIPDNEQARLVALYRHCILDTAPEHVFDELLEMAADICKVPVATITLVDKDREWYKSRIGITDEEAPRDISFCAHTILGQGLFIVPDTLKDERFADNPFVTDDPPLRFYAAFPLITEEGYALGTLCVIDHVPRRLNKHQKKALQTLAMHVGTLLDLRKKTQNLRKLETKNRQLDSVLSENENCYQFLVEQMSDGLIAQNEHGIITFVNNRSCEISGYSRQELIGQPVTCLLDKENQILFRQQMEKRKKGEINNYEITLTCKDGHEVHTYISPQIISDANGDFKGSFAVVTDITARKQAEVELHKEKDRVQQYLEIADVIFVVLNQAGEVTQINRKGCEVLGYKENEILGKNWFKHFLPESFSKAVESEFNNIIAGDLSKTERYENPVLTRTGEERVISWHNSLIYDDKGNVIATLSSGEDITEIKRAQESLKQLNAELEQRVEQRTAELQESETRFQQMADNVEEMFWMLEAKDPGRIVFLSPSFEKIWGLPTSSIKNFAEGIATLHAEDRERVACDYQRMLEGKGNLDSECRIVRPDGEIRWIWVKGVLIRDKDGNPYRAVGITQDITERKQAEEKLWKSEETLNEAQKIAHLGSWTWNIQTGEEQWSDEIYRIFGYQPQEIQTTFQHFHDILHPDDRDRVIQANNDALEGTRPFDCEFRILTSNGDVRFIHSHGEVYRNDDGQPEKMVGTAMDITERKRQHDMVLNIAKGVSAKTGQPFFTSLVEYVATTLGADIVSICELEEHGKQKQMKTLAAWADNELVEHFDYELADTPCEIVIQEKQITSYTDNVAQLFPEDSFLQEQAIESYVGIPLLDSSSQPLGGLSACYRQPLQDVTLAETVLQIFAARATAELERLKAEESLLFTQFAIDHSGDAAFWMDANGRLVYVNDAACRFYEYTREELLGLTIHDIDHDVSRENWKNTWQKIRQRENYSFETIHHRKNGTGFPVEVTVNFLEYRGKEYNCTLVRDISEHKLAQMALRTSEAKFATAFRHSPDGVVISTLNNGRIIDVSENIERMTGYQRDAIIGQTTLELGIWSDPEVRADMVKVLLKQGVIRNLQADMHTRNGELRHCELSAELIDIGSEQCILSNIRDITERKQLEEDLRFASFAMENAADSIYWIKPDGSIFYVNNAACEMLGYTHEELLSMSVTDINPDYTKETWGKVWDNIRHEKISNYETYHRAKDGRTLPIEVRANYLEFAGKEYDCAIVRDISERKAAERTLYNLAEGFSATSGEKFFQSFTKHIGDTLDMDYVVVGEIVKGRDDIIHSVEVYHRGEYLDPLEYSLKGTPCHQVISKSVTGYASGIQQAFPDLPLLTTLNIEGYVGSPLFDLQGQPLGLIAVLNCKPISNVKHIESLLQIFAIRAAAELERKQSEEALLFNQFAIDHFSDAAFWVAQDASIVYVNDAACRSLGYNREELLNLSISDIDPDFPRGEWDDYWQSTKHKKSDTFETSHHRKDGRIFPVEIRSNHLNYQGKEYRCTFARDITDRKQAEANLHESRRMLATLMDNLPGMVYRCKNDENWTVEFMSEGSLDLTGHPAEEFTSGRLHYAQIIHPDDQQPVWDKVQAALDKLHPFELEYRIHNADGTERWVWEQGRGVYGGNGQVQALEGFITDITDRKSAETTLKRTHRALTVLSDCNHAMLHAGDETQLLNDICRIIVETGNYRMAWVGYAERDENKTVRPVAHWGYEEGYIESLNITWADEERGHGPTGNAIRSGKSCVARNIDTEPNFTPWRQSALERGYSCSIAIPLLKDRQVFGALMIYADEPGAFTTAEMQLLEDLADNLAYGISALRTETEREQAKKLLIDSENKFSTAFRSSPDAITLTSIETGRIIDVNQGFEKLSGYSRDEVVGQITTNVGVWNNIKDREEIIRRLKQDSMVRDYEVKFVNRAGEVRLCSVSSELIILENKQCAISIIRDITEQKQAEKALLQNEEHLRFLYEENPSMYFTIAPDGTVLSVNEFGASELGYTVEELTGQSILSVFPEKEYETVQRHLQECLKNFGQLREWEIQKVHKNGEKLWVKETARAVGTPDNKIAVLIVCRDITKHKEAEEKLKRNHEITQSLLKLESEYISGEIPSDFFDNLLAILLSVTNSEYGFIGDVLYSERGTPYLKTRAITNIAWNEETQKFYEENASVGLEFTNLDNLFGTVIKTGKTVLANAAKNDPRSGGLPHGHPALNSFLGLPLYLGKELVGMAGMANRPNGYDEELAQELQPLLYTCANVMEGYRNNEKRLQIEEELRDSEIRLKNAQRIAHLGFWDWTIATGELYWSEEVYRIFNIRPGEIEITYKVFMNSVHPDDRAFVEQRLNAAISKEMDYSIDHRILLPGGEIRYVHEQGEVSFDKTGEPVRMVGAVTDITEHKQAQEALQESEEQMRLITESVPAIISYIDAKQVYRYNNAAYERYFLAPGKTIIDKRMTEVLGKKAYKTICPYIEEGLAGRQVNFEFNYKKKKDGSTCTFDVTYVPHLDTDNKVLGLYMLSSDITERKQNEELLRKSREKLRNLATRLQDIREEERTRIAREIHDELGQRLTALKMDLSWVVNHMPKTWKKLPERLQSIISLTDSTLEITREMALQLRPAILDDLGLEAAVEWAVVEFSKYSGLDYTLNFESDFGNLDTDRDTIIFRVLQESLTNIARHANATHVDISLKTADSILYLVVNDNGTGIDHDKTTSSHSLGLIGMHERAGSFGGRVYIDKNKNGGTQVRLVLPLGPETA